MLSIPKLLQFNKDWNKTINKMKESKYDSLKILCENWMIVSQEKLYTSKIKTKTKN